MVWIASFYADACQLLVGLLKLGGNTCVGLVHGARCELWPFQLSWNISDAIAGKLSLV
jgi:hypothetical protein